MANKATQVALLVAVSGLLFFLGLGTLGLTDRDEGSNAEAAREMVETDNWLSPTLNYEPRFAKPVFVYWLMGTAYRLAGVSEFAARLPSAVFGVALVLLQYWFLSRVINASVGFLGALMLLLNIEVVAIGRLALTDSVLIFFTTLAVFGFWLGLHGKGRQRHYFWLFYVGMAVGMLTKGPVGILVPLLAIAPYLTATHRWREFWRRGFPIAGTALFVLLATPWYAAMLAMHGSHYTGSVQSDTVGRFFSVIGGHGGTILFYVPVLLFGFFPWSGFLPAALYDLFKRWRAGYYLTLEEPSQELDLLAGLWLVAGFVFFSLSATRLPHYIGPLFPAAAIVIATFWQSWLSPEKTAIRRAFFIVIGTGCMLGLALVLSRWLYAAQIDRILKEFPMAAQVDPGWEGFVAGLLLLLGMPVVGYYTVLNRPASAFWFSGGLIGIVLLIAIQFIVPRFGRYFIAPPQELAYIAGLNLDPEGRLILYGHPKPSLIFYAQHRAVVIRPGEEDRMKPHVMHPDGRTMILLPSRLRPTLPSETSSFVVILERGGYSLLANKPMVQQPSSVLPRPSRQIPGH